MPTENNTETEKLLPPGEEGPASGALPKMPSTAQQSWGTVLSIIVIVLMIVVGAFYAWGKRIAENRFVAPTPAQEL